MTSQSLLRELQGLATDDKTKTTTLLLKGHVLAARLADVGLEQWLRNEVQGYPADAELPEFRTEFARNWAFEEKWRPKSTFDVRWPFTQSKNSRPRSRKRFAWWWMRRSRAT